MAVTKLYRFREGSAAAARKPLLLVAPHYMGSLRYFEKLIPLLADRYEVCFFLFFAHTASYREMEMYCANKKYSYLAVDAVAVPKACSRLPFFTYLANVRRYRRAVLSLLADIPVAKMIAPNDNGLYIRLLFTEAARRGIDTMVLQWALAYHGVKDRPPRPVAGWRRWSYRIAKPLYLKIKRSLLSFVLDPAYRTDKGIVGGGASARFGVINEQAFEYYRTHGVRREKMTIVGSLEFAATEAFAAVATAPGVLDDAARHYGINRRKKNIILYSSPFNLKDVTIFTDEEQYRYAERLISLIRGACPPSAYDVLFKIHPAEDLSLYRPLEALGVKLFGKDAVNQELIALSDLYIADNTNTNFITILLGRPAIFINLMNLPLVEKAKDYFGIRSFVHSETEFSERLRDFCAGRLAPQYHRDGSIFTPRSAERIRAWIG